ncbi:hypothetical protein O6H91_Y136300 [Diphasiastrum complanatum]|nr:hypothetical protein O6H91_Y136300 [Diphasiastrum complanatum]
MQEQLPPPNQMLACGRQLQDRRNNRPNPSEEILKCPRCDSSHTKFCYYNNYSLAQPRHFCRTCKRYWTKGGALRNVPVGGGCRKNKRTKQRSASQAPSLAPSEEALLSSIRCDGASSSAPMQREFSVGSSSQGLLADNNGDGVGLTFERLDQGSRAFPGSSVPLSINWAGHVSSAATLNLQPFESTILGLNLAANHVKQEPAPLQNTGDLSSIFDPQLNLVGQVPPSLGDTVGSYNLFMDSFGMPTGNGDIQWRLPAPRLVTMLEGGHNGRFVTQIAEDMRAETIRNFRKSALEEMTVPTVVDNQGADRLPHEWQSHPEGFFDSTGDGVYWSNGGWPQDDMYAADQ